MIQLNDAIFLVVWSFIGSLIGYFAFSYTPKDSTYKKIFRCILSVSIGMFIAVPMYSYLVEVQSFTKFFSITLSGLSAFGLPDLILKHWPKVFNKFIDKRLEK